MKNKSFVVEGLNGKKTLKGDIYVGGAKNAALKAMAASVLFDKPVKLFNVPKNRDVGTMTIILEKLGAKVLWKDEGGASFMEIDCSKITSTDIDPELAVSMRSSVVLTGPLLARFGRVSFPAPGGCVIGARPIDLFIEGYKKLGATIELRGGLYIIEAKNGLNGDGSGNSEIFFNIQTVGGTETLIMASVFAKGKVTLKNCAMEPEIVNVAEWLVSCGADIEGLGSTTVVINGNSSKRVLESKNSYMAVPDRIETGSFMILAALCADDVTIKNCNSEHVQSLTNLLLESGVNMEIKDNGNKSSIRVFGNSNKDGTSKKYKAFNVRTHEYPGFPTDLQSPIVTFLTQTEGESIVFETIFEGRLKFTDELQKMGSDITVMNAREVNIRGPKALSSSGDAANLLAHDIRGGFAVLIASIFAKGKFKIDNVHLIDRGYEDLENRLQKIGVKIERV